MAVDIRVRIGKTLHPDPGSQMVLNDDGYYWFLHPLFERLRDQCGKYIDLYGDAVFTRDDYPRLRQLLDEAVELAKQQPQSWDVHVGTQLGPTRKELYKPVQREQLLKLIATLGSVIDVAERMGGQVECVGD